ncbi:VanZ family protein [Prosthecobacter fusiformis]|uniref:VanZ family protein n=1 Tax=Prosthecobacter fusiformis TaxID=48464 RepID=A0A4R7RMZ9_9BACT|nr:VanZ family protein [Prosthecobacter fusiformis]TDU66105.1 VanZ family protein [Prosthecobacter fusiformis]
MVFAIQNFFSRLAGHRWFWWACAAIWGIVLFTLSSRSTLPPGPQIPYQDKVIHFLYFSGGGFCCALALFSHAVPPKPGWVWWLTGILFGMIVGALDEYHQTFTPGRSGNDAGDWLADLTGAGTGAWIAWILLKWVRRQVPSNPA